MLARLSRHALAGAAALFAAGLAAPAGAEELTEAQEQAAVVYAWDNATFTMYHEIGHMLVDLYNLPVLAKEEDAVDNLATLMALDDHNRFDDPIVVDAAEGWIAWMRNQDVSKMAASDFFDEHSINAQRAYQMICLLAGSDREAFGETATKFGLSDERQQRCEFEFQRTKASWDQVLLPNRRPNLGERMIKVEYAPATPETQDAYDILTANEVLEGAAKAVEGRYTLPKAITFRGEPCGAINAFYNPGNATITLCYEIVQDYYDQYRRDVASGLVVAAAPDAAEEETPADAATEEAPADAAAATDETGGGAEGEDAAAQGAQ